jgi:hypothetical protein
MVRCGEASMELFDSPAFLSPKAQPGWRKLKSPAEFNSRGNNHA